MARCKWAWQHSEFDVVNLSVFVDVREDETRFVLGFVS